jgi:hypothetical protein
VVDQAHLAGDARPLEGLAGCHRQTIERAFGAFCFVLFILYFGLHSFRYPWVGDLGRHAAAVASLYQNFLQPSHEAMAAPGHTSEMHTPYIVAVAGLGRLLGVTPYRALQLVSVANLIFYVCAIWLFFRTFSIVRDCWIPPVAFLLLSLFLRDSVYTWSSETSFASMRLTQAYPSLFGWGVALTMFSVADRYLRLGRNGYLPVIGLGIWVLVLSHTVTASWVIGVVALRSMFELVESRSGQVEAAEPNRPRPRGRTRALMLSGAMVSGIVLTYLWPYFDITQVHGMWHIAEGSKFGRRPFRDMARLYALALPAGVWLLVLRKHVFLIVSFVATWAALQLFRFVGFEYGNRYAFFQAFFAQVAVAEVIGVAFLLASNQTRRLPDAISIGRRVQHAILLFAGAALVMTATAPVRDLESQRGRPLLGFRELMALPPTHDAYYRRFEALRAHLGAGDVVLMPITSDAWNLASITGARVVVSPFAFRVPDYAERVQDVARFLSPESVPEARAAILRRYGVTRILLTDEYLHLRSALSRRFGPPLVVGSSSALFDTGAVRFGRRRHEASPAPSRGDDRGHVS